VPYARYSDCPEGALFAQPRATLWGSWPSGISTVGPTDRQRGGTQFTPVYLLPFGRIRLVRVELEWCHDGVFRKRYTGFHLQPLNKTLVSKFEGFVI
jgi:hypothetical protein